MGFDVLMQSKSYKKTTSRFVSLPLSFTKKTEHCCSNTYESVNYKSSLKLHSLLTFHDKQLKNIARPGSSRRALPEGATTKPPKHAHYSSLRKVFQGQLPQRDCYG
jgi:hypothetical protein